MIFSATATHALRAMARLAAAPSTGATLGRDLAEELEVPVHYLSKVLAALARAGLLTAARGARGGYRLARPAKQIALLEIVAPFEGQRLQPGCLLQPDRQCDDGRGCSAHAAWGKVKTTYLAFLEGTTLADIQGSEGLGGAAGRAHPGPRRRSRARPRPRAR
jgi:Rrf2 family protein